MDLQRLIARASFVRLWVASFFLTVSLAIPGARGAPLPARLVLLLDGVSYQDLRALQEGEAPVRGDRQLPRQAFRQGYFPASRLISTFPSISDIAWTEIMGNDPPPGYQRTYFRADWDAQISCNGVTGLMEYEKQMTWHLRGNCRRTMSYSSPVRTFHYELNQIIKSFLRSRGGPTNYYALIEATDTAQHSWGNIRSMLCALDAKLEKLRAIYRAHEGRELEILIISDHGNDHAGGGKRVAIKGFLKRHGYVVAKTLSQPRDVVLPTAGVESWVEVHNRPDETRSLVRLLSQLQGVDLVTARDPDRTNCFIVRNLNGEQARIGWRAEGNSFNYQMETGDPLQYRDVVDALARKGALDAYGFATADDWMKVTLDHRYPLALERIVRGHAEVALNPASILLSLRHGYVNSGWLLKNGIDFVKSGGTHGALDSASSTGVLLSSFVPTRDTSTSRVAALFDGFQGRQDCARLVREHASVICQAGPGRR